jgi:hypothetical protein
MNLDGIVYAVSNRSLWLPEREGDEELLPILKIGRTSPPNPGALKKRMGQLFTTNIVLPFDLEYAKAVENSREAESKLHRIFASARINPNREFFRVDAESVIEVLDLYPGKEIAIGGDELSENITQADIDARNSEMRAPLRGSFDFEKLGIPVGAELVSTYDFAETAKVVGGGKVEYCGKVMSVHAAARLAQSRTTGDSHRITGSTRWKYQGITLHIWQQRLRGVR